jgi:beta-galactosidase/beta-glucuronidase
LQYKCINIICDWVCFVNFCLFIFFLDLEDQDFWRLSGIFRDVFLTSVPNVGIWDIYAAPDVDFTSGDGTITLYYSTVNHGSSQVSGYTLRVSVVDPNNRTASAAQQFTLTNFATGYSETHEISTKITIQNVQLWSSEFPLAYGVQVELLDGSGTVVEAYRLPLGFRKLVANGNTLYFNNKKMKIRGVNRHEMVPTLGYTVPRDYGVKDLTLMKQAHVNFIRTCHYPNDIRVYEEANRFGLMILDECNVVCDFLSIRYLVFEIYHFSRNHMV